MPCLLPFRVLHAVNGSDFAFDTGLGYLHLGPRWFCNQCQVRASSYSIPIEDLCKDITGNYYITRPLQPIQNLNIIPAIESYTQIPQSCTAVKTLAGHVSKTPHDDTTESCSLCTTGFILAHCCSLSMTGVMSAVRESHGQEVQARDFDVELQGGLSILRLLPHDSHT